MYYVIVTSKLNNDEYHFYSLTWIITNHGIKLIINFFSHFTLYNRHLNCRLVRIALFERKLKSLLRLQSVNPGKFE